MRRSLAAGLAVGMLLVTIWFFGSFSIGLSENAQGPYYGYLPVILKEPTPTPTVTPTSTMTPTPAPSPTANPRSDPITETQKSWIQEIAGAEYDILRLHQLTPCENAGGMHIAFLEVRDQNGAPLDGVTIVIEGSALRLYGVSGSKAPGKAEIPLSRDNWKAYIEGATSDVAMELREDLPDQDDDGGCPGGNRGNHYSYQVIFQKTR